MMNASNRTTWLIAILLAATNCSASAQSKIIVKPESPLLDETIHIRVENLEPDLIATLTLTATDLDGETFVSFASFQANDSGVIDLTQVAPLTGSYQGVDSMGLFWSMNVAGDKYGRATFNVAPCTDIETVLTLSAQGETLATKTFSRASCSAQVISADIREDGLYGILFQPENMKTLRPGVIVLGGSEGGVKGAMMQAQLLASHGYAALALGYFSFDHFEGLPETLQDLPLEYFNTAVEWMKRQSFVDADLVVLLGGSKGAEAVLLTAAYFDNVAGVIAVAPSSVSWAAPFAYDDQASWSLNGEPLPFVPYYADPAYNPPSGFPRELYRNYGYSLKRFADEENFIPIERTNASILLISGEDDRIWASAEMAQMLVERAREKAPRLNIVSKTYPDAGHSVNAAQLPTTWTPGDWRRWPNGGTPKGNAEAQDAAWREILDFLESL